MKRSATLADKAVKTFKPETCMCTGAALLASAGDDGQVALSSMSVSTSGKSFALSAELQCALLVIWEASMSRPARTTRAQSKPLSRCLCNARLKVAMCWPASEGWLLRKSVSDIAEPWSQPESYRMTRKQAIFRIMRNTITTVQGRPGSRGSASGPRGACMCMGWRGAP